MTYSDELITMPDSHEDADKIMAEFALPAVPGSEQLVVEQVVMVAQRLNMPDEHLKRLAQAIKKAARNAMSHCRAYGDQMPIVLRVLLLSAQAQLGKPAPSLGWGFFVLERTMRHSGQARRVIELFLYQEGNEHEHVEK